MEISADGLYHISKREIFLCEKIARFYPAEKVQHGRRWEIFPQIHGNHEDYRLSPLPSAALLMDCTQENSGKKNGHGDSVFLGLLKQRLTGYKTFRNIQASITCTRAGNLEGIGFFALAAFGLGIVFGKSV